MKKLALYLLSFWILLPIVSQAMWKKMTSNFSNTNKFFIRQNFHTSATQYCLLNHINFMERLLHEKKLNESYVHTHNQFVQLNNQFDKINNQQNWKNSFWSEREVSSEDIEVILHIITHIESQDINKSIDFPNNTFLTTCIDKTRFFPNVGAEKIIKKLLEKGAGIGNLQSDYFPLWYAVLRGNFGAYKIIFDSAEETHLLKPYKDTVLRLPFVISFGLNRLKIIEEHYTSELQKIKNGERIGYSYRHSSCNISMPYNKAVRRCLERASWYKNRFQKIEDHTTNSLKKRHTFALSTNMESLINSFLEQDF